MQAEELKDLVQEICAQKVETQTLELKAAAHGCPTKLFDTLSAFSNQDGGGLLVFGIDENNDFAVCGVYNAQDLQKRVTEQCKQMEPVIRALFTVCEIDGKTVVSAEIPGVDIADRPVFYKGVGRIKGSYIREGESDELMSEYEIYSYEAFRKRVRDDVRLVDGAKMTMIDRAQLENYIRAVKAERKNLSENVPDTEILELMGVTAEGQLTLAGLLTFSRYPQTCFPQLCITAVALPGVAQGELGEDGARFIDNRRITGSVADMLEEAVEFVQKNSRTRTIIDDAGHRRDKPEYPMKAVREAILNALVHRDYSLHTENVPIRLEMYRDRMEITNPGGLYGKITIDVLGKVQPETRNAALANMLELLKITENRYSGIPTMRTECARAELPAPVFSVAHGEFKVTLRNIYGKQTDSLPDMVLEYCENPRSRDEIIAFTGKSRNYCMSQLVLPLVHTGKLRLTLPDKPRSVHQKYVTVR